MAYRDVILATSGLVSYWALDEASGATASDQGDSNPGTYNAVTLNQAGPGPLKSASFNGSSSYVTVPTASNLQPTTAVTVECWCNPGSAANTSWGNLVEVGYSSNNSPYVNYSLGSNSNPGGVFSLSLGIGGSLKQGYGTTVPTAGRWYHVVGTYDGSFIRVYVNGALESSTAFTGSLMNSGQPLQIGRMNRGGTTGQFFSGQMAAAAVYNTALSLSDIQSHYNAGIVAGTFTLTGPTKGYAGVQTSQPFVVQPNGGYTGTITLSDGGAGGTFSPSASATYTGGSSASNVYYTPSAAGTVTISASASPSLTAPSSLSLAAGAYPGNYAATVLTTTGLSYYWQLGETSGTAAADSADSNAGAYTGTYTLAAAGPSTMKALSVSGSGYVATTTTPTNGFAVVSVEAWVYLTANPGSNAVVAGFRDDGGAYDKNIYIDSSGRPNWYVYDGGGKTITGTSLSLAGWHHIVGTADGTTAKLYIDGVLAASTACGNTYAAYASGTTGTIRIAGNQPAFANLSGRISNVSVYHVALSLSDIQSHYNVGNVATSFTLTGPTKGYAGVQTSQPFVVQPNGGYTGTITLSDGGAGGTFSPSASATYTGGVSASNVYYTPSAAGTVTISASASPSLTAPSSLSLAVGTHPGNYAATVLGTMGLLSYWALDEASGATASDQGDSNPGTYNAVTLNQAGPGPLKSALFNGSSSYVTVPTASNLQPTTAMSVEAWCRLTNAPGNGTLSFLVDKGYSANSNPYDDYALLAEAQGGVFAFSTDAGGSADQLNSVTVPTAGQWYHIVGTYDGTTKKLYVNGVLETSVAVSGSLQASGRPLQIGRMDRGGANGFYFNGQIAAAAVYNTALSLSDIRSHYNATGANPTERASQAGIAAIAVGTPKGRASHGGMAAIVTGSGRGRASHGGIAAAVQGSPRGRASHVGILAVVPRPEPVGSATLATRTQIYASDTTPTTFAPDNVSQVLIVAATQGSPSASLSQSLLVAIASPSPMGTVSQIGALVVETTSPVANVSQASALVVYQMIFVGDAALSRSATLASTGTMPYYGNASLSTRKSISSTGAMPWYGTATLSTGKSFSSSGTHSPPLYIGTCSVSTRHTAAIGGTFTPLVYAGNASVQIAASSSSSGTFTLPVYIGLATLVTSRAISSAGTHTPPTYEGSCVVAVHPTIAATGVAISAYIGDASLSARCVFTSTGVFVPPVYVGVCVVSRHPTLSGTGTVTVPTYIGDASLSVRHAIASTGTFSPPAYVGVCVVSRHPTFSGAGTFTPPTYIGTASLSRRAIFGAVGSVFSPSYVGNATLVVRHMIVAAGTFTMPVYVGRATLVVRHTVVASGTFTPPTYAGVAVLSTRTTLVSAGISLPPIYGGTLDVLIIDVGIVSGGVSEVPVYSGNADLTVLVEETVITGTNTYKIGKYFIIAWVIRNNHE